MSFRWTTRHPSLQTYIDDCLRPYNEDFTVWSIEDIVIHLTNGKEHTDHIRKVLQRLQEIGQCCKAERFQFGVQDVGYPELVIN